MSVVNVSPTSTFYFSTRKRGHPHLHDGGRLGSLLGNETPPIGYVLLAQLQGDCAILAGPDKKTIECHVWRIISSDEYSLLTWHEA